MADESPGQEVGSFHVFMSYRRADDPHFSGRFYDRLSAEFGRDNVFRDIDSIPVGEEFARAIVEKLAEIDAVVVLIGPNFARPIDGRPDFVRIEIAEALRYGYPIIPVLIEDTTIPEVSALPPELHPLLELNAVRVRRDPDFHRDADRVIEGIHRSSSAARSRAAKTNEMAGRVEPPAKPLIPKSSRNRWRLAPSWPHSQRSLLVILAIVAVAAGTSIALAVRNRSEARGTDGFHEFTVVRGDVRSDFDLDLYFQNGDAQVDVFDESTQSSEFIDMDVSLASHGDFSMNYVGFDGDRRFSFFLERADGTWRVYLVTFDETSTRVNSSTRVDNGSN